MGTIISIGIHAEQEQASQLYTASLRRLSRGTSISRAMLQGWVSKKELGRKPATSITAGNYVFTEEEIPLEEQVFHEVVREVPFSKKSLEATVLYPLASGEEVPLSLFLYGKEYESGSLCTENGYIRLMVSMNDVDRPIKNWYNNSNYKNFVREDLYADTAFVQLARKVTEDWDSLFLRICGIDDSDVPVDHAAMYLENGWPSPECCSMIFHRNKAEFFKDFLRIYRFYFVGKQHMPSLLSPSRDLYLESDSDPITGNKEDKTKYYKQFDHEDKELICFLESLDVQGVHKLASLSVIEVKTALDIAGEWADKNSLENSIKYIDFGENGAAVLGTPASSVWRFYEFLYLLLQ